MWAKPTKKDLASWPKLYSTEKTKLKDKIIVAHFFVASCDWYIVEFDGTDEMFGFANLGIDQNAEWGYISLQELRDLKIRGVFHVDFDKHWNKRLASEVKNIVRAQGW